MRAKTIVFLIIGVLFLLTETHATHYMGGEITWECLPNGRYRFKMRVYRECYTSNGNQAANFSTTVTLSSTGGGISSITLTRLYSNDVSPQCNTNPVFPRIFCPGMPNGAANMGAIQEHIYTSDSTYPTGVLLTGVPPPAGWTFSWSGCCRNPATNVNYANSLNWYLRAKMFPYNNQNVNPCFDNSPQFVEPPSLVICSGYPFQYQHITRDEEKDSITFEWGQPLVNATTPISNYAPGYSFNNPLPGIMHHPNNVPGNMNIKTGAINFTSFTTGAFISSVKVTAWRCGIRVAEIWRDIQFVILPCDSNLPPVVGITPGLQFYQEVYAGDSISFMINATDLELLPDSQPQTVILTATGTQFGINYTSTTFGCTLPPCATLSPPPPLSAVTNVQTTFGWKTECHHLYDPDGCGTVKNSYSFLFKVRDDFCPVPAIRNVILGILVKEKPPLPPPAPKCVNIQNDGSVLLLWKPVFDTLNAFESYIIFYSHQKNGPYQVLDSLYNIFDTTYTDVAAANDTLMRYYVIRSLNNCVYYNYYGPFSDTLVGLKLSENKELNTGNVRLEWIAVDDAGMGDYLVFRADSGSSVFNQLAVLQGTVFTDSLKKCLGQYRYRVEYHPGPLSKFSCIFASNILVLSIYDLTPPPAAQIISMSYNPASDEYNIGWTPVSANDFAGYILFKNIGGSMLPSDTLSSTQTSFTDAPAYACSGGSAYQIQAFDSCLNLNAASLTVPVYQMNAMFNLLTNSVELSWPQPGVLLPDMFRYTIYVMKNYGPWMENVSLPGNAFQHKYIDSNSIYCYYVKAVDSTASKTVNSCPVCVQTGTYTGIGSQGSENVVRIFPNPTKEEWRVVFGREESNIRIELFDVSGRRVLAMDKAAAGRGEEVLVSAAHLPEGVYLMRIQTEQQIHRKVVLINK